jgi:ribose/xylose/arabinose/galactoside ABC-type transport system permease subunit
VYLALALLVLVASIWAPAALGSVALRALAPYGAILAITALGQFTMAAVVMAGVGAQSDDRVGVAIGTALIAAAVIGLVNGILIGALKLNALIVTLAVGQLVIGLVNRYGRTFAVQRPVPESWTDWTTNRVFGVSIVFWMGLAITALLVIAFRYTTVGRKFQIVGSNPVSAHVVGLRVNVNQIAAYVAAAVLYAVAGLTLAGLIRIPGVTSGAQYLLGPIAAVVIGGASLTGGLASPLSTTAAAFFLTGLNQMMLVMGLPTSLQFVVFGAVIIGGMLVSGDRIIKGVEQALRERRRSRPRTE